MAGTPQPVSEGLCPLALCQILCHCQSFTFCFSPQVLRDIAISQEAALLAEKVSFLKTIDLFKDLLDSGLEKIAEVMDWKEFPINERIIRQGDAGNHCSVCA